MNNDTFEEAMEQADGDGGLSLHICHYLNWDVEHPRLRRGPPRPIARTRKPRIMTSSPAGAASRASGAR